MKGIIGENHLGIISSLPPLSKQWQKQSLILKVACLLLQIQPPAPIDQIISSSKASAFKEWLDL